MADEPEELVPLDGADPLETSAQNLYALAKADYTELVKNGLESKSIGALFTQCTNSYAKGDWDVVEDMARKVSAECGKMLDDWRNATRALDRLKNAMESIDQSANVKNVAESLSRAEDFFKKGDYVSVLETVSHVEQILTDIRDNRRPVISLAFAKRALSSGQWNRTKVVICNDGNATAKNVRFEFNGPVEVLRFNPIARMMPGDKRTIEIGIKATEEGEIPLDIWITYQRDADDCEFKAEGVKWISFANPHDASRLGAANGQGTPGKGGDERLNLRKGSDFIASHLKKSHCYLVHEETCHRSFEIFSKYIGAGSPGLCLTRTFPKRIYELYEIEGTKTIWLTNVEGRGMLRPSDLEKIRHTIGQFLKDNKESMILLDGVEYLITHNKYESVLKFIQSLKDQVAISKAILIVTISPHAMDITQLKLLEREVDEILK